MFPAAASALALPGKEEVLRWKSLAMKLVGFSFSCFDLWPYFVRPGVGGQRSVCILGKEPITPTPPPPTPTPRNRQQATTVA